ncbi:hypothetical protein [Enterobacter sp. 22325]|uniref:hypothetical protein n=1 Tax=Enterobacter sp. 22325 TaxID=3453911 RepID=UPI003F840BB1
MSTITKEWLQKAISQHESMRDEIPFGLDEDDSNTLAALRIALASLEAEPAIHRWRRVTVEPYGPYPWHYGNFIGFSKPVEGIEDEYYYSAPPVPLSVPDEVSWEDVPEEITEDDMALASAWAHGFNQCRAAMLQGVDGAITNEDTKRVDELVMWIKRLAHSLRKSNPDSKLQSDAMDYLSRKGLVGVKDILR